MTLTIVGLGPGSVDDISRRAWHALEKAETVFLATAHHAAVPHLPLKNGYCAFDDRYSGDLQQAFQSITATIMAAAQTGQVVYAVPGDPLVGEPTTRLLREACAAAGIALDIVHGISFIEPMLAHVGLDALDGLQILDGQKLAEMHHPPLNPDFPAFIAGVYDRHIAAQVQKVLLNQYAPDFEVMLIHRAGTDHAAAEHIVLKSLADSGNIGQFTALAVPAAEKYSSFEAFQEIIAHLRAPEGCPWDRKQTHASLRPYLLEEAYETLEAIDNGDWQELAGELGDLLLQIVLHTQIATEHGEFQMREVMRRLNTKMIRRHPHVWGDVNVDGDADRVVSNWEIIKQQEQSNNGAKKRDSLLDGLPKGLSALMVAYKYNEKAAKVGFDWPGVQGVEDKLREEMNEIFAETDPAKKAREIGDLIFVLVNWLRWLKVDDPESLLREINAKFYRRFHYIEQHAPKPLLDMTLAEMDALWNVAKAEGL